MDNLELRLESKIMELSEMLKLYADLNKKTKGRYDWRQQAIEAQIDALEQLRDNYKDNWMKCYKEDLAESNRR